MSYIRTSESKKGRTFHNFTTPVGTAIYPKLVEADEYKGKRTYKAKIAFPADEIQGLIDEVQHLLDEFVEAEVAKDPKRNPNSKAKNRWTVRDIAEEEIDDDGNPTGRLLINLKKNATSQEGEELDPPALFDSFNNNVTGKVKRLYGGSQIAAAGFLYFYAMGSSKEFGVAFKLQGVQIVKLVEGGGGATDGASMGFGAVEGGFAGDTAGGSDPHADDEDEDEDF